ncbi:MAG: coenzyme F420-0:L-glutamate ligase [Actinomycetota bacterium]
MAEKIPIRTRLITENDNLPEVVAEYTKDVARPGDVIAVAQKIASITQGRIIYAPTMRVSWLARFLCRFVGSASSQHSPEGMQAAIDEVGYFRVLLGALAGGLGKLMGRKGDFYRITGEKVFVIDDAGDGSGTVPPYNRYVILAPIDPDALAEKIKKKTGVDAAIMDCSYTGSHTLGASKEVDRDEVADLLKDNPFGNFDEMSPIVVIKQVVSYSSSE